MKFINLIATLILAASVLTLGCRQSTDTYSLLSTQTHSDIFRLTNPTDFELYGNTSGYGTLKTDGIADFGLVLKSFTREDLFQIELNDLMSTTFDRITIIGNNIDIPSNVALPQQKERFILSITLNKPTYKIQFDRNDDQKLVFLHGQFPFNDVVQGFRNEIPLLKLADKFNILSFSEYNFENTTNSPRMNLDLVAGQKKLSHTLQVKAPLGYSSDYSYVVVALDKKANTYLANNLTVLLPNETKNLKITANNTYIFNGLIHESFSDAESKSIMKHKMSFQLSQAQSADFNILDFIENLNYTNETLSFTLPNNQGLTETGLAYNIVEINKSGKEVILVQDFITGPWTSSLDLSGFNSLKQNNHSYRLDLYVGAAKQNLVPFDYEHFFEISEFISRNSINL